MPDKLPKGWVKTTLGEIRLDASLGISQQQMYGETFELYSVPAFEERKPEILPGEKIGSNKITVAQGDVLLCKINPRINRAWVVAEPKGQPQIGSTEWIVFSKQEGIVPEFLAYFFAQDAFRNYLAGNVSGVGGSLMRVRPAVVESIR
jgi:type I restriction enzyme, S subunit